MPVNWHLQVFVFCFIYLVQAMGNGMSSSGKAAGGAQSAAIEHIEDLHHLARIKKAEDARKEAIAANVHDINKVVIWEHRSLFFRIAKFKSSKYIFLKMPSCNRLDSIDK